MSAGTDHYAEAEAVLAKAQQTKNNMLTEGDWEPLEAAAALQVLYAEAQVHATLAAAAPKPLADDVALQQAVVDGLGLMCREVLS